MKKRLLSLILVFCCTFSLCAHIGAWADGAIEFCQINDVVSDYLAASESYDVGNPASVISDYDSISTSYSKDRPVGYEVISVPNGSITVSGNNKVWTDKTNGETYTIYNLVPGISYSYETRDDSDNLIDSGNITATGQLRMIYLTSDSVRNVRDEGGWPADGGTVKYDLLFRGFAIDPINERDKALFLDWLGISTEIDLRQPDETDLYGRSALGKDSEYIYIDMRMDGFALTEVNKSRYNKLMNACMDNAIAGKGTYIHCIIGTDRTGQAGIILLGLLGVDPKDLARDYELSAFAGNERQWESSTFQKMLRQINALEGATFQEKCARFANIVGIPIEKVNEYRHAMIDGTPSDIKIEPTNSGIFEDPDGKWYYCENGERVFRGLFYENGYYYYADTSGEIVRNGQYTVEKDNNILPTASYTFDDQGHIIDIPKNGFVWEDNDELYYYENNKKSYKGVFVLRGWYYYANPSGRIQRNTTCTVYRTNDLIEQGHYMFDDKGHIICNVTWVSDGSVLATEQEGYNRIPEYDGDIPIRNSSDGKTYVFAGWTPELTRATQDAVYTAVFEETEG